MKEIDGIRTVNFHKDGEWVSGTRESPDRVVAVFNPPIEFDTFVLEQPKGDMIEFDVLPSTE